jgi:hypothetical protein
MTATNTGRFGIYSNTFALGAFPSGNEFPPMVVTSSVSKLWTGSLLNRADPMPYSEVNLLSRRNVISI